MNEFENNPFNEQPQPLPDTKETDARAEEVAAQAEEVIAQAEETIAQAEAGQQKPAASANAPYTSPDPASAQPAPEPPQEETFPYSSAPQYGNPSYSGQPAYQAPPQYQPPQYAQPPQQSYYRPQNNEPPAGYVQKSRLAAGLLGILLGVFGVHNYYLGFNTKATIQLIVSLAGGLITCGVATLGVGIWGFIEGILYLSGNTSHLYDGNGVILRD